MESQRLRPLSGIAFVALVALAIVGVAGETPGTDASGSELVSFYGDSWRQFIAAFVLAAATVPPTSSQRSSLPSGSSSRA